MCFRFAQWIYHGPHPTVSWCEDIINWVGGIPSETFFTQYQLMAILVICFEAGRSDSTSRAPRESTTTEELDVLLGSSHQPRHPLLSVQAVRSKPYLYAIAIHILCISLSFGCRSAWVLLSGLILATVKYLLDKVAEFRFFSDPVAQSQVRPRFLRRGGQHLALLSIKMLSIPPILAIASFALAMEVGIDR